jgi:hypothetical protein
METNELQDYIETISVSPHVGTATKEGYSGMLGMGEGMSLLASFMLSLILAYVIGCFYSKKKTGKMLVPNKEYWFRFFKYLCLPFYGAAGIDAIKTGTYDRADKKYHPLTKKQFDEAEAWASSTMTSMGITYPEAYKQRAFDCENFARIKAQLMVFRLSQTVPNCTGAGFPIGTLGLLRHGKKDQPHEMVHANIVGSKEYYLAEAYPSSNVLRTIEPAEKKTINFDVM